MHLLILLVCSNVPELKALPRVIFLSEFGHVAEEGVVQGSAYTIITGDQPACASSAHMLVMLARVLQELKKPLRVTFLSEDGRVPEEGVDQGGAYTINKPSQYTTPAAHITVKLSTFGCSSCMCVLAGAEEAAARNFLVGRRPRA
jgi:hypothetical protein